jgi:hypothetical protein
LIQASQGQLEQLVATLNWGSQRRLEQLVAKKVRMIKWKWR